MSRVTNLPSLTGKHPIARQHEAYSRLRAEVNKVGSIEIFTVDDDGKRYATVAEVMQGTTPEALALQLPGLLAQVLCAGFNQGLAHIRNALEMSQ